MKKSKPSDEWVKDYIKIRVAEQGKAYGRVVAPVKEVDFIRSLLAQEHAKAYGEVREWIKSNTLEILTYQDESVPYIEIDDLLDFLNKSDK